MIMATQQQENRCEQNGGEFFAALANRHVLLLQGPMGPFFSRLARDLAAAGALVTKVNFCAGDALFHRAGGAVPYRGSLADWPAFFADLVYRGRVDVVMLFGDCRPYHDAIRKTAQMLNVPVYVFEEGYLRPDYITLERGGVNARSPMRQGPQAFHAPDYRAARTAAPSHPAHTFARAAWFASVYSLINCLAAWRYPHYQHHRNLHPLREGVQWLWSGVHKLLNHGRDRRLGERLARDLAERYFLVPLQVHNDAQVTQHSRYGSVNEFIIEVIASFARHAAPHHHLVFKHHPLDRPYRNYRRLITETARAYGVRERVHYGHDLHLPTLLEAALGTVVINSTVGISSLCHATPVHTLGEAIYAMPGLTHQGTLPQFWQEPGAVDAALFARFRAWLALHNQANGSFYRRLPDGSGHTGMRWFSQSPFSVTITPAGLPDMPPVPHVEPLSHSRVA
ncbi:MAG: capsular biosynthesis protein [Gammaproteobacteria bacterium HGW-Gammaproteobacteria-1]|jgi:capsule polysaccharide modification protein KpsS|nr:MAG: capsular biosynthesis protein [Gammaproteobacteria bacterium HGW-Gammaproteobacteria-1]